MGIGVHGAKIGRSSVERVPDFFLFAQQQSPENIETLHIGLIKACKCDYC